MKFGALLDYAYKEGFNCLATGHYCQRKMSVNGFPELWEGLDKNKDQSYFLARITREQLTEQGFRSVTFRKLRCQLAKNLICRWQKKKIARDLLPGESENSSIFISLY